MKKNFKTVSAGILSATVLIFNCISSAGYGNLKNAGTVNAENELQTTTVVSELKINGRAGAGEELFQKYPDFTYDEDELPIYKDETTTTEITTTEATTAETSVETTIETTTEYTTAFETTTETTTENTTVTETFAETTTENTTVIETTAETTAKNTTVSETTTEKITENTTASDTTFETTAETITTAETSSETTAADTSATETAIETTVITTPETTSETTSVTGNDISDPVYNVCDINHDCKVDVLDLTQYAGFLLDPDKFSGTAEDFDLNKDSVCNALDLLDLANYILTGTLRTYSDGNSEDKYFIITLDADNAPLTCQNFEKLVTEGFYDGLTFHRIVEGFVAQGGDPEGNGTGGSSEMIKGEFSANGVDNKLPHLRGVVSMARRGTSYDSATSQFFICYDDCRRSLDGNYAAFGVVTEGMDVVDDFLKVEKTFGSDGRLSYPVTPIRITKAYMISDDAEGRHRVKFVMDF